MKTIVIDSELQKTFAYNIIKEMPLDGTCEVITKKVDTRATTKQQGLWWLWCGEVAVSGLGSYDTKNDVHISSKWRFVRPILLVQDELFGILYESFMEKIKGSACYSEYCKGFSDLYIHTGDLTKRQRAESLTEFKNYWTGKGLSLTDPDSLGKNLLKYV